MLSRHWFCWLYTLDMERLIESNQIEAYLRTYCVGLYADIPESHREWIRKENPWFLG